MDHSQATNSKAVEQYLLGELHGDLRAEFEEHFMSCAECARDVRAGVAFVESARDVLRSEAREAARARPAPPSWLSLLFRPMIAAPAMLLLLAVIGYQSFVAMPRLEMSLGRTDAPQTLQSFSLINENSRGSASPAFVLAPGQPFSLYVDVPPQPAFPMYTLEIDGENGAANFTVPVSGAEAKSTVQILIPGSHLAPGRYSLVIKGSSGSGDAQGTEVARYGFSLQSSPATNSSGK